MTYNDRELDQFVVHRTAAFMDQQDNHIPCLTVRETLNFSARCQGSGQRPGLPCSLSLKHLSMDAACISRIASLLCDFVENLCETLERLSLPCCRSVARLFAVLGDILAQHHAQA